MWMSIKEEDEMDEDEVDEMGEDEDNMGEDEDENKVDEIDGVRWVGGGYAALSSGSSCFSPRHIKCPNVKANPLLSPRNSFCIGFASTKPGFPFSPFHYRCHSRCLVWRWREIGNYGLKMGKK